MRSRLAIGLVLLVIAAGCGKKSNNPMNPGGGGGGGVQLSNGSMSASFNGSTWNAIVISVSYPIAAPRILAIGGTSTGAQGIAFALFPNGTGTYTNATSIGMNFVITDGSGGFASSAGLPNTSGTIILTTLTNNRAVGTFQCVATGTGSTATRTITNGTFDVTF